jgi:hypothetical protein
MGGIVWRREAPVLARGSFTPGGLPSGWRFLVRLWTVLEPPEQQANQDQYKHDLNDWVAHEIHLVPPANVSLNRGIIAKVRDQAWLSRVSKT